jgi:hypothetical protein
MGTLGTEGVECGLGAEVELVPNQSRRGENALAKFRLVEDSGLSPPALTTVSLPSREAR